MEWWIVCGLSALALVGFLWACVSELRRRVREQREKDEKC